MEFEETLTKTRRTYMIRAVMSHSTWSAVPSCVQSLFIWASLDQSPSMTPVSC